MVVRELPIAVYRDVTRTGATHHRKQTRVSLYAASLCSHRFRLPISSCIPRVQATHYACVHITHAPPMFAPQPLLRAVLRCTFTLVRIKVLYPKEIWNKCCRIIYELLPGVFYIFIHSEAKRPLGRRRRRWVDNIRMDLREIR
jgi:hypothetical protein